MRFKLFHTIVSIYGYALDTYMYAYLFSSDVVTDWHETISKPIDY